MSRRSPLADAVAERLARITAVDADVRSLVRVDVQGAIAQAHRLDAALDAGEDPGPLAGVLVAVKDNVDVAGQVTACGSRAHDGRPAVEDAVVLARLRRAGVVVVGRANMDELAMGASTATSADGPTRNPWDPRRSPGGSSGGCAAAVALGLVDLAVGTDTGGSVREPAAQCGVLGLAPSPGLVPVDGVVPFAPSCDRVGPITTDAGLMARALDVMAGRDAPMPSLPPTPPILLEALRVGVVEELCGPPNQPGVRTRVDEVVAGLEHAGARVRAVSVPDAPRALAAYLDLTSAEAVRHLGPFVATRRAGHEVTRRLAMGQSLLDDGAGVLATAGAVRARLRQQVAAALVDHDVLLCPTLPTTAPLFAPAGPPTVDVADPMRAPYTDCWTVVANLADVPALSVPAGLSHEDGMPVGVMLLAAPGDDARLVGLAGQMVGTVTPDLVLPRPTW